MSENRNYGVLSEVDLLELLNIEKPTLDALRQDEGFPFIRLNRKNRAYLVADVLGWLEQHRRNTE
jgi:hypothetical protein